MAKDDEQRIVCLIASEVVKGLDGEIKKMIDHALDHALERKMAGHVDKYLTPKQVMASTGLSRATVYKAIWAGDLKSYSVGKNRLISTVDFEHWVKSPSDLRS